VINPTKVKVPRRVTISAAAIALLVFLVMLFLLSKVEWNGSYWAGILALFLFSGLSSFSVFMMIISTFLSRRIQKLQNGEPFDDD
jgi:pilus assembly protein TadC